MYECLWYLTLVVTVSVLICWFCSHKASFDKIPLGKYLPENKSSILVVEFMSGIVNDREVGEEFISTSQIENSIRPMKQIDLCSAWIYLTIILLDRVFHSQNNRAAYSWYRLLDCFRCKSNGIWNLSQCFCHEENRSRSLF